MTLHVQFRNGSPQIFKPEVPERRILHGTPDAIRSGRHRFKLTFTQVPRVLFVLRLLPFPILLKEVRDLLWHRYLLTIVDDNDRVVHFVSFPLSTEGYTPALPVQRQKLSTFMELPAYRVVIMPYGIHECLRSHRGVDLTGKPRDLAFAYHHYRTN